ncbi:MAG TPA: MFS transporter [Candidatus Lokiarchaeia archaeon]|nr:MFS transporter [Candidatus Lokiarchaeia archaeon]
MSQEQTEEKTAEQMKSDKTRKVTQRVVNASNMINAADQSLYPLVFSSIQNTMGISVEALGFISTAQGLTQAATTPIWGWLNDKYSRRKVLTFGCIFWGVFTIFFAFSQTILDMVIYRLIIGIGLGVIVPTAQSIIADYFPAEKRGVAFGMLGLMLILGVVFGAISATLFVSLSADIIPGLDNWRFVFVAWGFLSIGIGVFVLTFAKDPVRGALDIGFTGAETYTIKRSDFKKILTNKTFLLIICQGMAGSIPWTAIYLMPTWLEYVGFVPLIAGAGFLLIAFGAAGGTLFGGWIGDKAAKWNTYKGRILVAQISVAIGIPMVFILFFVIPPDTSSFGLYLLIGIITGFSITWSANACNNPIFSEIFPPEIRGSAFAVDRLFEGGVSAFGTWLVTIAAALLGFQSPTPGEFPSTWTPNQYPDSSTFSRTTNMLALGHGMFWIMFPFWVVCLILYTLVYKTYPKDSKRAKQFLEDRAREKRETKEDVPSESVPKAQDEDKRDLNEIIDELDK